MDSINQANINRAAEEKEQTELLLQTTLEVAASITGNISDAVIEADKLKDLIGEEEMKAMALDVAVQKAIDFVVEAAVEK